VDTLPASCLLLARAPETMDARKQVNEDLLELGSLSYGEGGWRCVLLIALSYITPGVGLK